MTAEERLARAFIDEHPSRAAKALEQLPASQAAAVLRVVPPRSAAAVVGEMTTTHAAGLLGRLEPSAAAAIAEEMSTQHIASVVRALDPVQRERLMSALPEATRDPLARVIPYPHGTAGAAMDPSVFRLPSDVIVADARARLRRAARDLLYYVYVVDREQHLVGVLDIPQLMLAPARERLSSVMQHHVEQLSAWMPVTSVQEHPGWQRHHALPVVDEEQRLLGAIRYQTLRRLERETAERAPDASLLTARALGELFQIGTTGMVAGVAASASVGRARERGSGAEGRSFDGGTEPERVSRESGGQMRATPGAAAAAARPTSDEVPDAT